MLSLFQVLMLHFCNTEIRLCVFPINCQIFLIEGYIPQ
uniref:Uncharacterized protein n=1 Tax=Arundo donax TaxID=35708 RepID=A0A0A8YER6_ARUDO